MSRKQDLKQEVHNYWNAQSCGTFIATSEKYSKEYYNEIEAYRYQVEPEILAFADFKNYEGKKVLEVGVGAGTDFTQWCKNGAIAHGIDLTEEGITHVQTRLKLFDLAYEALKVGDAENIPFEDNTFDLVYSWGVIHHSPNTEKAFSELVRVCKPGGEIKFMVYHLDSVNTWFFWVKHCLLKFNWTKARQWALWNFMESFGTKAYTHESMKAMVEKYPIKDLRIESPFTYYDDMSRFGFMGRMINVINKLLFSKEKHGWFLKVSLRKS